MNSKPLFVATIALALGACSDNRTSIEIIARAAPSDATTCLFTAGGTRQLGTGKIDVAYGNLGYGLAVYVQNNLADPDKVLPGSVTDAKAWRAENARVRLNPKDFTDKFGANPGLLAVTGEALIGLTGQTTPPQGQSVEIVQALSAPMAQSIITAGAGLTDIRRVVLGITLQGRTLDGAKLDTGEWYYSVNVCDGCLPAPAVCPTAGQVLSAGNCFAFGQDNVPVCTTP